MSVSVTDENAEENDYDGEYPDPTEEELRAYAETIGMDAEELFRIVTGEADNPTVETAKDGEGDTNNYGGGFLVSQEPQPMVMCGADDNTYSVVDEEYTTNVSTDDILQGDNVGGDVWQLATAPPLPQSFDDDVAMETPALQHVLAPPIPMAIGADEPHQPISSTTATEHTSNNDDDGLLALVSSTRACTIASIDNDDSDTDATTQSQPPPPMLIVRPETPPPAYDSLIFTASGNVEDANNCCCLTTTIPTNHAVATAEATMITVSDSECNARDRESRSKKRLLVKQKETLEIVESD